VFMHHPVFSPADLSILRGAFLYVATYSR
jgi:hypothetical protein